MAKGNEQNLDQELTPKPGADNTVAGLNVETQPDSDSPDDNSKEKKDKSNVFSDVLEDIKKSMPILGEFLGLLGTLFETSTKLTGTHKLVFKRLPNLFDGGRGFAGKGRDKGMPALLLGVLQGIFKFVSFPFKGSIGLAEKKAEKNNYTKAKKLFWALKLPFRISEAIGEARKATWNNKEGLPGALKNGMSSRAGYVRRKATPRFLTNQNVDMRGVTKTGKGNRLDKQKSKGGGLSLGKK